MQKGFSPFSWALALFCLPSALWPLALLVSPKFSSSPHLSASQIEWFSIAFWTYPLVLFVLSLLLHRLHRHRKAFANGLLLLGFGAFYTMLAYIVQSVLAV